MRGVARSWHDFQLTSFTVASGTSLFPSAGARADKISSSLCGPATQQEVWGGHANAPCMNRISPIDFPARSQYACIILDSLVVLSVQGVSPH